MRASPALVAAGFVVFAPRADAFDTIVRGATVSGSIATTPVGDALMGELGGQWGGLRVLRNDTWVLQWETLVAIKAGWLGNEHPFLFLAGPHASAWVEVGRRFRSWRRFSPYVGLRLAGDAQWLGSPDVASLDAINSVDGVGGIVARGAARLAVGNAYFDEARSFIVAPFIQEELDAPELHTQSLAFTEMGIEVRYDLPRSLTASFDGLCGLTFDRHDASLGTSDSTMRCGLVATFRKIFGNGMWLGASLSFQRDTDHLVYASGGTYETADAPVFQFALTYGVQPWRTR